MRVQIKADSVSTRELRDLVLALHKAGVGGPTIGLNGPEAWSCETPLLSPDQFATTVGNLVKHEGRKLVDVIADRRPAKRKRRAPTTRATEEGVVRYLAEHPGQFTSQEVAKGIGTGRSTAQRFLKLAYEHGLVDRGQRPNGHGAPSYVYSARSMVEDLGQSLRAREAVPA